MPGAGPGQLYLGITGYKGYYLILILISYLLPLLFPNLIISTLYRMCLAAVNASYYLRSLY